MTSAGDLVGDFEVDFSSSDDTESDRAGIGGEICAMRSGLIRGDAGWGWTGDAAVMAGDFTGE